MHLSREILYALVAFLAGGILGMVAGFCLFGAWLMGWLFPATVPDRLATNDMLSQDGKQRSKLLEERAFAWSDRYDFIRDEIGNVTYRERATGRDGGRR